VDHGTPFLDPRDRCGVRRRDRNRDLDGEQMNILVTGGCGFIGSHLVDATGGDIIDNLATPFMGWEYWLHFKRCNWSFGDVRTAKEGDFDRPYKVIYHLAAIPRIQPSIRDPESTFNTNVMGTLAVLELAKTWRSKVIFASSSSVYGNAAFLPTDEHYELDIRSPYSLSKKVCEDTLALYHRLYGLEYVVLRFFNVYGPRQPMTGGYATVLGIFQDQQAKGTPLTIVGDGEQRRDFTHVSDVVRACQMAVDAPCGIYNIGTGVNYSINEIAAMFGGPTVHLPERPGEYRATLASIEKAKGIGWSPKIRLEDYLNGIKR